MHCVNNSVMNCVLDLDQLLFEDSAKGAEVPKTTLDEFCCFAHDGIRTHHYDVEYVIGSVFKNVTTSLLKSNKTIGRRIRYSMYVVVVVRTLGFKNLPVLVIVVLYLFTLIRVCLLLIVLVINSEPSNLRW